MARLELHQNLRHPMRRSERLAHMRDDLLLARNASSVASIIRREEYLNKSFLSDEI